MRPEAAFGLALGVLAARPVAAQSVSLTAARWLTSPHVTDYRLSITRRSLGPIGFAPILHVASQGPADGGAFLAGAGAELTVRLSSRARPYLVGGLSGGFLDFKSSLGVALWSAWSAGVGAELIRTDLVALALEARWQQLSREATTGLSLGIRLGSPLGSGRSRRGDGLAGPESAPTTSTAESPVERPAAGTRLVAMAGGAAGTRAAELARSAMGAPYRWGGTDRNGFDCSGLIRYVYAKLGIALPRTSAEQSRAGWPVEREIGRLAPGDLLAFGARPGSGAVTHVGLYLGDRRFIHSSSTGVRVGVLSDQDPDGKWWHARWIAARRLVE